MSRAHVQAFFDAFDEAFASFDGDVIAQRYAEPYLACRADGDAESFADADATGRYFQGVLDDYRAAGVETCRHRDLEVAWSDDRHADAAVTWELVGSGGDVIVSWRESYLLVEHDGRLLVRASIDHA